MASTKTTKGNPANIKQDFTQKPGNQPMTAGTMAPTADMLQSKWPELKSKVKTKWNKLTDEDIAQINGRHEQLVSFVQARYGYDRYQAEQEVREFLAVH